MDLTKLPEGIYNKVLVLTMQDGDQVVARLPTPGAGPAHYTTASEVAIMAYVRNTIGIPVPKILTHTSQTENNAVGAEDIIMEKCPGVELDKVWDDLSGKQICLIAHELAEYTMKLYKTPFSSYESLYCTSDLLDCANTKIDEKFCVGPTTRSRTYENFKEDVNVNTGPCKFSAALDEAYSDNYGKGSTAEEAIVALLQCEAAAIHKFAGPLRHCQKGLFNGPGGYQPTKKAKLNPVRDVGLVLPHIVPQDLALSAPKLYQTDLNSGNIFVDENCPTKITGIVGWQNVHLSPAFLCIGYPPLIRHQGPELEAFAPPQLLPNAEELSAEERKEAKALYIAQSVFFLFKSTAQIECPDFTHAIRYQASLPSQIMGLACGTFDDGEPVTQTMLASLADPDIWAIEVRFAARKAPENKGLDKQ